MNAAARAFAHIDLAVASALHKSGVDVGGVESQRLLNVANQAAFEHLIDSGAAVEVVRSPDGHAWCPVVIINGSVGSICRGAPVTGPVAVKKRRATCAGCLAALA